MKDTFPATAFFLPDTEFPTVQQYRRTEGRVNGLLECDKLHNPGCGYIVAPVVSRPDRDENGSLQEQCNLHIDLAEGGPCIAADTEGVRCL